MLTGLVAVTNACCWLTWITGLSANLLLDAVVYLEARAASARMLKMYGPESRKGACNHQESSTSERLPRYPEDALINEREAFWPWQRVLAWWSTFLLDAPALREAGGVRLRSLNTTSLTSCFCKASVWSALSSKVHSLPSQPASDGARVLSFLC
jgi:hypothetical protein